MLRRRLRGLRGVVSGLGGVILGEGEVWVQERMGMVDLGAEVVRGEGETLGVGLCLLVSGGEGRECLMVLLVEEVGVIVVDLETADLGEVEAGTNKLKELKEAME